MSIIIVYTIITAILIALGWEGVILFSSMRGIKGQSSIGIGWYDLNVASNVACVLWLSWKYSIIMREVASFLVPTLALRKVWTGESFFGGLKTSLWLTIMTIGAFIAMCA